MLNPPSVTTGIEWSSETTITSPQGLLEQLGSTEGLSGLSQAVLEYQRRRNQDVASTRRTLQEYIHSLLLPLELPTVMRAWRLASQGHARELIALDAELSQADALSTIAPASQRVGRIHLKRLAPLRDHRMVQRYLQAIERGEAAGWHMVVFGIILATYSIPLRQGLVHYAQTSLRGLIQSTGRQIEFDEDQMAELESEACAPLPSAINSIVSSPFHNTQTTSNQLS